MFNGWTFELCGCLPAFATLDSVGLEQTFHLGFGLPMAGRRRELKGGHMILESHPVHHDLMVPRRTLRTTVIVVRVGVAVKSRVRGVG